jgi:enoyl-CoA hydratase
MLKLSTDKMTAEKDGGIGWMTFNNPARRNAMSLEMWEGLTEILTDFAADDDIRVIVMKGAGDKAFVSGADISQFEDKRANAEAAAQYAKTSEEGKTLLETIDKPLIAMIRGYCLGGGLGIAMSADMRFASDDSKLGIPAARLSIAYGFDNLSKLVQLVGPSRAKDILFTARRVEAAEAYEMGLVNKVTPAADLEAAVREACDAIVDNAPLSILASKFTINQTVMDLADRDYERIGELSRNCFDSDDYKEGRTAFMEKRKPVWKGR